MIGRRLILGAAVLLALGAAAGVAYGAFAATTSNPASSIAAARIYPGTRTMSAWAIEDAADGGAADATDPLAYANDGATYTTSTWTSAFASTRYVDIDFNSPLPAGVPVAGASFRLDFRSNGGTTGCMYFEVRRASTGAVLGTFGSSGSPVSCQGTSLGTSSTDISSSVTTTDVANDLRIRVYGNETNNRAFRIDRATIDGAAWTGFTLYQTRLDDTANGTPSVTNWEVAAPGDGSVFRNKGNWSSSYASGRYLKFTFPSYVPSAATITAAQLKYTYKSNNAADTTCYYFEVYNGASLVASHGSTSSDVDCNATTSYVTATTSISEVDTPAEANNLVVKLYSKVSGSRPTLTDGVQVQITYALPYGTTCAASGTTTVGSSGDAWIRQDSAANNQGTDTLLDVRTQSASRNRRALIRFELPPLPYACSVTAATLRLYLNTTGGARTLNAYQVAAPWTEAAVTWATKPTTTGTAATATTGPAGAWTQWPVTEIAQALYAGTNYGFMIQDSIEDGANLPPAYMSRENSNVPEFQLTLG
ncbi:MAG: DNRLRE domain-containing protein [Gaiellaceae bacterium]